ncbi:hypothetical protein, partial [Escherichia coli]|uniref:hypothetical protein n=1 Tax=Escherichia coli TaxID=562 RepID=UPI003CF6FBA7
MNDCQSEQLRKFIFACRAGAYKKNHGYINAIADFKNSKQSSMDYTSALNVAKCYYYDLKDYKKAEHASSEALSIQPENLSAVGL